MYHATAVRLMDLFRIRIGIDVVSLHTDAQHEHMLLRLLVALQVTTRSPNHHHTNSREATTTRFLVVHKNNESLHLSITHKNAKSLTSDGHVQVLVTDADQQHTDLASKLWTIEEQHTSTLAGSSNGGCHHRTQVPTTISTHGTTDHTLHQRDRLKIQLVAAYFSHSGHCGTHV